MIHLVDMDDFVEFELNVPSGKIVVANDLRPWFPIDEKWSDIMTRDGVVEHTLTYAQVGLAHAYVQNSCPSVFRDTHRPDLYTIGVHDAETWDSTIQAYVPNPEPCPWGEEVASITTRLWWYSICDADEFQRRKDYYWLDETEDDELYTIVPVRPGVYRFRHTKSFTGHGGHYWYSTFEWIREPDPVRDYIAEEKAKTRTVTEVLLQYVLTFPESFIQEKERPRMPELPDFNSPDWEEKHKEYSRKLEEWAKYKPLTDYYWTPEEAVSLWKGLSREEKINSLARASYMAILDEKDWHENGFPRVAISPTTKALAEEFGEFPEFDGPLKCWDNISAEYCTMLRCSVAPDFVRVAKNICRNAIQYGGRESRLIDPVRLLRSYTEVLDILEDSYPEEEDESE